MRHRFRWSLAALGAAAGLLALAGCSGGSQLSQQEMNQIKQGPPREMPPEARQMMERAKAGVPAGPGSAARPPATR